MNRLLSLLLPVNGSTGQRDYVTVTLAWIGSRIAIRLDCDRDIPPAFLEAIHASIRETLAEDGIGSSPVATLRPADFRCSMGAGLG